MSGLVQTVVEDLIYLQQTWGDQIKDDSIRRGSPILRRFLVENQLQQAWRQAGFSDQPIISASSLRKGLATFNKDRFIVAAAGGARFNGMEARCVFVSDEMSDEELSRMYAQGLPNEELPLADFIRTPCMIAVGSYVSRLQLVKYVCNKLGGVHYDERRTAKGKAQKEARIFQLLDFVAASTEVVGKQVVYFELLSIGQALCESEDVKRFLEKVGT